MGNPPPCPGILYTTPSSSIFVYKNSLRKLWNYPINHAEKTTSFWSYQGMILTYHNEAYKSTMYLPNYLHPWKKKPLNRRWVSESPFCKARLNKSTSGPALHARWFTKSPTIDFCNYNYIHRCQSDYSIKIEGYNFTIWNRTSKNKCLKYENDIKKKMGKTASEKIAWQSKHLQRKNTWYTCKDLTHFSILVMTFCFIPVQKMWYAGLRNSLRQFAPSATTTCMLCAMRKSA